jgi:predicted nucleic-acid-binding protein
MRAVDTNVLVRLITRDNAKQVAAADAFVEPGAWVSVLALAEAVWVLAAVYEREPGLIAKAVEMLLNHQQLTIQEPEAVAAALEAFRRDAQRRGSRTVSWSSSRARRGICRSARSTEI